MTDTADTPLPAADDGEPDFAAEIARLEEAMKDVPAQIEALNRKLDSEIDYEGLEKTFDGMLSEKDLAGLPTSGSRMDRLFYRIVAIAEAAKRPVVPATDTKRPSLTPAPADLSSLPAYARIAAGYGAA